MDSAFWSGFSLYSAIFGALTAFLVAQNSGLMLPHVSRALTMTPKGWKATIKKKTTITENFKHKIRQNNIINSHLRTQLYWPMASNIFIVLNIASSIFVVFNIAASCIEILPHVIYCLQDKFPEVGIVFSYLVKKNYGFTCWCFDKKWIELFSLAYFSIFNLLAHPKTTSSNPSVSAHVSL